MQTGSNLVQLVYNSDGSYKGPNPMPSKPLHNREESEKIYSFVDKNIWPAVQSRSAEIIKEMTKITESTIEVIVRSREKVEEIRGTEEQKLIKIESGAYAAIERALDAVIQIKSSV